MIQATPPRLAIAGLGLIGGAAAALEDLFARAGAARRALDLR
jgi:hypothetical protein